MAIWNRTAMELKREFVEFALTEGANFRELCRRYKVSPTTGYKWLERYRCAGVAGLVDLSRRPHGSPRRSAVEIETAVLGLRNPDQLRPPPWLALGTRKHRPSD